MNEIHEAPREETKKAGIPFFARLVDGRLVVKTGIKAGEHHLKEVQGKNP